MTATDDNYVRHSRPLTPVSPEGTCVDATETHRDQCRRRLRWRKSPSRLPEHSPRRIASGRSHDAASRMRGRSAHPEISDGRRVSRPAGNRTQEKQLIEGEFAVKDIALCQPEVPLQ